VKENMNPSTKHHVVPPDELCCVWMTAGILSYQLCDRELECDQCPLDSAMRKHFHRRSEPVGSHSRAMQVPAGREGLREGHRYSPNHCWIRQISPNLLRLGIEPGMGSALLTPRAVVYPSRGQMLQKGQTCLWVVMEGGTLPIDAPCGGIVSETNRLLGEQPHLLQSRPFDEGWLMDLQVDDAGNAAEDVMDPAEAGPQYTGDELRFRDLLDNALRKGQPSAVGATMADGGQPLRNIADMIGASRYFSITRRVYGA
jgi:glycine cleavage system H protein